MWDNTTLEYYDFDEFESIQSEVAFTYTTDFSRQLVSIKIVWKYFVNLFNLLGKHEDHFEKKIFFLAKWFLGGIFSLYIFYCKQPLPSETHPTPWHHDTCMKKMYSTLHEDASRQVKFYLANWFFKRNFWSIDFVKFDPNCCLHLSPGFLIWRTWIYPIWGCFKVFESY